RDVVRRLGECHGHVRRGRRGEHRRSREQREAYAAGAPPPPAALSAMACRKTRRGRPSPGAPAFVVQATGLRCKRHSWWKAPPGGRGGSLGGLTPIRA